MQDHSGPLRVFALFAIFALAACLTKPKAVGEQVTLSVANVYDDKADNGLKGTFQLDPKKKVDVGFAGGITRTQAEQIKQFTISKAVLDAVLAHPETYVLMMDKEGHVWFETKQSAVVPAVVISVINITVNTTDDNKEDSRFEIQVRQGSALIAEGMWGAGQNWGNGNEQNLTLTPNTAARVTGEPITVVAALQDGPWGQSNHWNCNIHVVVNRSTGSPLEFDGNSLAFRTGSNQRRHEISLGTRSW